MKLDIVRLLRFYTVLKVCHYNTCSGYHHGLYDKAFEKMGKLLDLYIETWMGVHGRKWEHRQAPDVLFPRDTEDAANMFEYEGKELMLYLYKAARDSEALRNVANDFDTEFRKIGGLLAHLQ